MEEILRTAHLKQVLTGALGEIRGWPELKDPMGSFFGATSDGPREATKASKKR